jgi:hypothetical protein
MRRKVTVQFELEFDDKDLPTPDVDEAIVSAVEGMKKLLFVMPALTGTSSRGRKVSFKVKDVELPR